MQALKCTIVPSDFYTNALDHIYECTFCGWADKHTIVSGDSAWLPDPETCFKCHRSADGEVDWWFRRDGYWNEWDNFNSYDSWKGEKLIGFNKNHYFEYGHSTRNGAWKPEIVLEVCILGKRSKGRLRPYGWYAKLKMGNSWGVDVGSGKGIKSLAHVKKIIDALDLTLPLKKLLSDFYSKKNRRTSCVWKKEADGWKPFLTEFYYNDPYRWDSGTYAVAEANFDYSKNTISCSQYENIYCGWSAHGMERPLEVDPWIDWYENDSDDKVQ